MIFLPINVSSVSQLTVDKFREENCDICITFSCKLAFTLYILAVALAFVKDKCYNAKYNVTVIMQRRNAYDFPEL